VIARTHGASHGGRSRILRFNDHAGPLVVPSVT
jgi:hypothetical protein